VSVYSLRCRVCEEEAPLEPVDACRRCDGPTDVVYDWDRIITTVTSRSVEAGPPSLWRYGALLPTARRVDVGAGWTPLVRAEQLSRTLGIDLLLKLEGENPTGSYKDRIASVAASAALDFGSATLCCSSTGNLGDAVAAAAADAGLEAIVLAPLGADAAGAAARHEGAHVLAVNGTYDDCRRLELELGALFPWGFVSGNLHPYAAEGAKTISFEIAEQLGWQLPDAVFCPAASGTLFAKLAQGFVELSQAGLVHERLPRLFAAQVEGSSPIADAFSENRSISRVRPTTHVASLSVGDPSAGELALGAARSTGGAVMAISERELEDGTALLAETADVVPDHAGGAALAALMAAVRRGTVPPGSRVVLVVTGARPGACRADERIAAVEPDAESVLAALGLFS
jgi:threonine synthase